MDRDDEKTAEIKVPPFDPVAEGLEIPRGPITWHQVGATALSVVLSLGLFLLLGALLFGCATVRPYTGKETTVDYREEFVQWDVVGERMIKRIFIDNPLNKAVEVELDCGTPIRSKYIVPAHSTRTDEIYDGPKGVTQQACTILRWEFVS